MTDTPRPPEPLTAGEENRLRGYIRKAQLFSAESAWWIERLLATLDAARDAREPVDVERLRQSVITVDKAYPGVGWVEQVATEYDRLASGSAPAPLPGDPDVRMTGDDY
jgi:hypothetical protein